MMDATIVVVDVTDIYARPSPPGNHSFDLHIRCGGAMSSTLVITIDTRTLPAKTALILSQLVPADTSAEQPEAPT